MAHIDCWTLADRCGPGNVVLATTIAEQLGPTMPPDET